MSIVIFHASGSPRRKKLIHDVVELIKRDLRCYHEISVKTISPTVEERNDRNADCKELVLENSLLKAKWLVENKADILQLGDVEKVLVIGSDTVISFEREVIGKPDNIEEARATLLRFSGKTHRIVTGVYITNANGKVLDFFTTETIVHFKVIDLEIIEKYFKLVSPMDKAGSYGIKEHGDMIIESVEGSTTNVMGLPVEKLAKVLTELIRAY